MADGFFLLDVSGWNRWWKCASENYCLLLPGSPASSHVACELHSLVTGFSPKLIVLASIVKHNIVYLFLDYVCFIYIFRVGLCVYFYLGFMYV